MSKVKIMARYNPTLDLTALALSLMQSGRTKMAARVFVKAASLNSVDAAISTLNASNNHALQASARRSLKAEREEVEDDLSDDQIDQILKGDFDSHDDTLDIDLDANDDGDEDDEDEEDLDLDEEDIDADLDIDLDEEDAEEEFAKIVAGMRAKSARMNRRSRR